MSYQKNTPGQKFNVLAVNAATGLPVTGDAANITAQISIDSGAFAAVTDTNPTEADATNAPGVYVFDLTQAETNGDVITIVPSSTTANVQLDMINIYTAVFQYKPFGLDSRIPTFLCDDVTLFWYISIYGADGTAKDADSNPTIHYRLDNDATLRSFGITVTKVSATTGLYKIQHNLAGLGNINDNTFIGYEESAVIDGVTYVNRWVGVVRSVATKTQAMDIENKVDDILVDTTAIDSKTSQLTFTIPNQVDSNSLTGGTSPSAVADAVWDEVLTGATHNIPTSAGKRLRQVADIGVYEGGQVWIDTVNGTAGTASYENGTVDLPSDNIADATTLATAVAITRFKIAPNSNFTLASDYTGFNFSGDGKWTLGLGGRDLNKTTVIHATVSGTCTSSDEPHFEHCEIGTTTLPACEILASRLTSTITLSSAGTYSLDHCVSGVAGTGSPVIDFGAAVGNTNLNMRNYSGGIQIQNMGQLGTDNMSLEGNGALTIDATCTGGTIALRGNFKVTDNSGGAVTIVKDDNSETISNLPSAAEIMASGDIDGYTLEEALKLCAAVLAGKVSGAGTTEITFRAVDDSKDRVVATVAGEGNRTSVTIDVTG